MAIIIASTDQNQPLFFDFVPTGLVFVPNTENEPWFVYNECISLVLYHFWFFRRGLMELKPELVKNQLRLDYLMIRQHLQLKEWVMIYLLKEGNMQHEQTTTVPDNRDMYFVNNSLFVEWILRNIISGHETH